MAIKEVVEDAGLAMSGAKRVRAWTKDSTAKVLSVLALIGLVIIGLQAIYVTYNMQQLRESTSTYTSSVKLLGEKLSYETAIDSIEACISSDIRDSQLHSLYCTQADEQFKLRTNNLKYPGAQKVFNLHAYVGMKNVLRSRLRGLELTMLESTKSPANSAVFNAVLSKAGTIAVTILTALLMLGVFVYLIWPHRKQAPGA